MAYKSGVCEMNANEIEQLAYEVNMWGEDLLALNMKGGVPVTQAAKVLRQQQAEIEALKKELALDIEEWKRKYKDMHNLATQAMSKVHQLEKEAQKK